MVKVIIFCVGLVTGIMIGAGIVGFYDSIEENKPKEEEDGEKKV